MKVIYESYELPESEFLERLNKYIDDKVTRIAKHIDEKMKGGVPLDGLSVFCAETKTETTVSDTSNQVAIPIEKLSKLNEKLQIYLADAHYELGKVKRMSVLEFIKWRRNQ
jgi:hypothetical protein